MSHRVSGDTPTCVGKSQESGAIVKPPEGHPHVCGEEFLLSFSSSRLEGTPPRVWGRAMAATTILTTSRDTPTCVGKSF